MKNKISRRSFLAAAAVSAPAPRPRSTAQSLFLKWFTEPQNNIAFAVESGYLPVTTAANDMDAIRASGLELTDDYFEAWYQATLAQLQQYEG